MKAMDDKELTKILKNVKAPPADDNARKRALNLAMSEFEAAGKEQDKKNQKTFQGLRSLARLMGITTPDDRRVPMKKSYVYGGLATAMVVVLVAGVSFQQFTGEFSPDKVLGGPETSLQQPADEKVAPAYIEAVEQQNEPVDHAVAVPEVKKDTGTPLREWHERQGKPVPQPADAKTGGESITAAPVPAEVLKEEAPRRSQAEPSIDFGMVNGAMMAEKSKLSMPSVQIMSTMDYDDSMQQGYKDVGRDKFEDFTENPIKLVSEEPVSTFSIDVDTSSYAFMRRQINNGVLPQKDSVRVEEMINYFDYDYETTQKQG